MAAKVSTIILDVDLDCHLCYKKIKKTLSKFPEIQSQTFDEKQNKVIIAGAFDPEKLMKKICCKACKHIKSFEIIIPQPSKSKPKPEPKPDPPQPKPFKENPPPPPPEPVKEDPPVLLPPSIPLPVPGIPIGPYGPMVCCRPCYEGHHGQGICRRYGYESGCRFIIEEDPYCRTM